MSGDSLVYSSVHGRMCPKCGRAMASCSCKESAAKTVPAARGRVRVGRETKGRKGKGVTVITGMALAPAALAALARQLKQKCGAGGTVRDGVIEIQGDQRDLLVEELRRLGWDAKRSD
jgi:translation initiation factor 1